MRKLLSLVVVLAAALLVAPSTTASSAASTSGDRGTHRAGSVHQAARVVTLRERVIELINNKRTDHGCRALGSNPALGRAAQIHTRKMAAAGDSGTLSHQLPGEAGLGARITAAGYTGWRLVGENIAFGYTTPADVVQGWMNSRTHRANILNCNFRQTGVGFARSANGTVYWTQDFGKR
ncbi:CAP domain-containing protein [Nocardioides humilatus]|nr:CAP domain-containing protein [Nocardioides humilatus]